MKIPGSALPPGVDDDAHVDTTLSRTNRPTREQRRAARPPWYLRSRWEEFGGKQPPMTPMRVSLLAKKKAAARCTVPLERCIAGNDLIAGWQSGRLAAYRLERARTPIAAPSEELQQRLCGAKWKLRGTRMRLLEWIALAMIPLHGAGLVATHAELGVLCEIRERWIAATLRDLRAWGLVKADPTFVAYGAATSQRANCYRLTTLAAVVFGLPWFGAGVLPDPEPFRSRPRSTAPVPTPTPGGGGGIAGAHAHAPDLQKTAGHPESTLGVLINSRETLGLSAVLAVSPATPSTLDFSDAVPADSVVHPFPAVSRETCEPSEPALQAGVAETAAGATVAAERERLEWLEAHAAERYANGVSRLAKLDAVELAPVSSVDEALERVRRGVVIERSKPDPEAPRDSRRWRREREARDRELVEDREIERIGGDVQDLAGVNKPAPASTNGRVSLDDVDEDLRRVLERANESYERRRNERQASWMRRRGRPGGDS